MLDVRHTHVEIAFPLLPLSALNLKWYRYGVMRKRATARTSNLSASPPDLRAVYLASAYWARRVLGPTGGRHPTMLASLTDRGIVHPVLIGCGTNEFYGPELASPFLEITRSVREH
jgi:hypothetical protein